MNKEAALRKVYKIPRKAWVDYYAPPVFPDKRGVPPDCPEHWRYFPLDQSLPLNDKVQELELSINTLGHRLFFNIPRQEFDLYDLPHGQRNPPRYRPPFDPYLKYYFCDGKTLQFLRSQCILNYNNNVLLTLEEFNQYRRFLYSKQSQAINQYLRIKDGLDLERIKLLKKRHLEEEWERRRMPLIKLKEEWFKERVHQVIREQQDRRERFYKEESEKFTLAHYRRLNRLNGIIERLEDHSQHTENVRALKNARVKQEQDQRMKHFQEREEVFKAVLCMTRQKKSIDRQRKSHRRWTRYNTHRAKVMPKEDAVRRRAKIELEALGRIRLANYKRIWDRDEDQMEAAKMEHKEKKRNKEDFFKTWWDIKTSRGKMLPAVDSKRNQFRSCWDVLQNVEDVENAGRTKLEYDPYEYMDLKKEENEFLDLTINQLTRRVVKRVLEKSIQWVYRELREVPTEAEADVSQIEAPRSLLTLTATEGETEGEEGEEPASETETVPYPFDFRPC